MCVTGIIYWMGLGVRGCRVEPMCKNAQCSPPSKLQSRMHTAPLTGGPCPAHLTPYTVFGKWALWGWCVLDNIVLACQGTE